MQKGDQRRLPLVPWGRAFNPGYFFASYFAVGVGEQLTNAEDESEAAS
jgi:hypothetical protein